MEKITIVCQYCFKSNSLPAQDSYKKANCGHCQKSLLNTTPIELSRSNFGTFLTNNSIPVVVDFWAPWCGPCKMMAPVFKSVSNEFPLKIRFAKVNVENEQIIGSKFAIKSIPTLILFKNGKEIRRISGGLDAQKLKKFLA